MRDIDEINTRVLGAIAGGVATIVAFALLAYVLNGLFAAVAFVLMLGLGAATPLVGVILLKSGFPFGSVLGKWLAILAQYVFGAGALVRREDGSYTWQQLKEADDGYRVELEDGTELNIQGEKGDLYRFGGRPLAIVEEKGRNVEQYTVREEPPETANEATRERRADIQVHHPRRIREDNYLISLKQLAPAAAGSAGPQLSRRGREKALEEAGGQQALGTVWLTLITGAMAVVGFVMGFGALML